jgi:hypothetical protein
MAAFTYISKSKNLQKPKRIPKLKTARELLMDRVQTINLLKEIASRIL